MRRQRRKRQHSVHRPRVAAQHNAGSTASLPALRFNIRQLKARLQAIVEIQAHKLWKGCLCSHCTADPWNCQFLRACRDDLLLILNGVPGPQVVPEYPLRRHSLCSRHVSGRRAAAARLHQCGICAKEGRKRPETCVAPPEGLLHRLGFCRNATNLRPQQPPPAGRVLCTRRRLLALGRRRVRRRKVPVEAGGHGRFFGGVRRTCGSLQTLIEIC